MIRAQIKIRKVDQTKVITTARDQTGGRLSSIVRVMLTSVYGDASMLGCTSMTARARKKSSLNPIKTGRHLVMQMLA